MNILNVYTLIIFIVAIALVCILFWKARIWKGHGEVNYSLFVVGLIILIPVGIFLLMMQYSAGYSLIAAGTVLALLGYRNKGKWTKNNKIV
jgi:hypothetical protein